MFRFTLSGRVVRKLVYIGHTILVIEANRADPSFISCYVRDEDLKNGVDFGIATDGLVQVEGSIEWSNAVAPNATCCLVHFVAETVKHVDDGARQ